MDTRREEEVVHFIANEIAKSNKINPSEKNELFILLNKVYTNINDYSFFSRLMKEKYMSAPFDFFRWSSSPEGDSFWRNIHYKFKNKI